MKKLNPLDIAIILAFVALIVLLGVFIARKNLDGAVTAQITFNMTEDTDAAKYVKIGDEFYIGDVIIGSVASIRSLDGGGIAITVNTSVIRENNTITVNGLMLKLGKEYTFQTKRILGKAVCDTISGE